MSEELRVDVADLGAMAVRWGVSAGEVGVRPGANGGGLSCQASAAAVRAAHVDVATFTAALEERVRARAAGVGDAGSRYTAGEAESSTSLVA